MMVEDLGMIIDNSLDLVDSSFPVAPLLPAVQLNSKQPICCHVFLLVYFSVSSLLIRTVLDVQLLALFTPSTY